MCIAVHFSALQCNFALFAFFVLFVLYFYFFCMIWFHTIILKPNKYKNHLFIAKTNKWILAPFISIHTTPCHMENSGRRHEKAWWPSGQLGHSDTLVSQPDTERHTANDQWPMAQSVWIWFCIILRGLASSVKQKWDHGIFDPIPLKYHS